MVMPKIRHIDIKCAKSDLRVCLLTLGFFNTAVPHQFKVMVRLGFLSVNTVDKPGIYKHSFTPTLTFVFLKQKNADTIATDTKGKYTNTKNTKCASVL